MKWLKIPVGTAVLWISGVIIYWILSAITILPWNLFFKADDVLDDMRRTEEKGGKIDEKDKTYALKMKKKAGITAVVIHLVTAASFLAVAIHQSSTMYYIAALAALFLTILRPSIRSIEHSIQRLSDIHHTAKFPRDDVFELKTRLQKLEDYDKKAKELRELFNERYEDLLAKYDEKCAQIEDKYNKNQTTIKKFEKQLLHMHREIIEKIDSFDDAVAFKTAWERLAPEFAKIFRGS